jgi:hypothetical protein
MANLEKLQPIANRVIDQYSRAGLHSLDSRDRIFFLAWCHGGELDNGGHSAFFYNSEADNYLETVEALEVLGLNLFSDLLKRAAGVLFDGAVPRSMTERNRIIEELPDEPAIDEELESIDQQFFANGGGNRVLEALEDWYFERLGA